MDLDNEKTKCPIRFQPLCGSLVASTAQLLPAEHCYGQSGLSCCQKSWLLNQMCSTLAEDLCVEELSNFTWALLSNIKCLVHERPWLSLNSSARALSRLNSNSKGLLGQH